MEKILVNVFVPVINEQYDLFVPIDIDTYSLAGLISDGVSSLSSGRFTKSGRELLIQRYPDLLLDPSLTLSDYNVTNGASLMLL